MFEFIQAHPILCSVLILLLLPGLKALCSSLSALGGLTLGAWSDDDACKSYLDKRDEFLSQADQEKDPIKQNELRKKAATLHRMAKSAIS